MGQIRYYIIAFWLLVALMILSFCSSCTVTKYLPVETVHMRSTVKTDTFIQRDSLRDSIFVSIMQKGDTVYTAKEVYKTKYLLRNTIKTDTVIQQDTITKIIHTQQTKTTWETITQTIGPGLITGLAMALIVYGIKK